MVVVQRPHSHTFVHVFVEGVQASVGVSRKVLGRIALFRPFSGVVSLVAADTEQTSVYLFVFSGLSS